MRNSLELRWVKFWMQNPAARARCVHTARRHLWDRYNEKHRAYHTLDHIKFCLNEFDRTRLFAANPLVVEAAIWFHDVIYDTRGGDNEGQSAQYACADIAYMGGSEYFSGPVRAAILATRHTTVIGVGERDNQLICDIDLASLGFTWPQFKANTAAIRTEYGWVSESDFRTGRVRILQRFLDREHIYYLPYFREKYEERARENLKRAIRELRVPATT